MSEEPTLGHKIAEKYRAECNKLTHDERMEIFREVPKKLNDRESTFERVLKLQ